MMEAMISAFADPARLMLLVGALLLVIGGSMLTFYAIRLRRGELAHRVNLVAPRPETAHGLPVPAFHRDLPTQKRGGLPAPQRGEIIRRLAALHIPATHAMAVFAAIRGASVLAMAALAFAAASALPALANRQQLILLVAAGMGIGGWFLPAMIVKRFVKARTLAVAAGLPDALELLVVCVEAGLALEDGLERIVIEMRNSRPRLAEELALTVADLKILPSRDQALFNLADRVNTAKVRSVITTLSQTMRYGTPLAQALRNVASEMRNDSLLELSERANRLPTLLTLPMMLFIMPTIFLIVGGPAALHLADAFFK